MDIVEIAGGIKREYATCSLFIQRMILIAPIM